MGSLPDICEIIPKDLEAVPSGVLPNFAKTHFSDRLRSPYLLHLGQLSPCVLVIPQVLLVPHQDDGHIGTEVFHLGRPLLGNVFCPKGGEEKRRRSSELRCLRKMEGWRGKAEGRGGLAARSHGAELFS